MRTLDRQKLGVFNQTRSNIFGCGGQFTAKFKPLEIEKFGNCGEFATIKIQASEPWLFNPVEFDGIKNSSKRRLARLTA